MKITALIFTSVVVATQSPSPSVKQELLAGIESLVRGEFEAAWKQASPKFATSSEKDEALSALKYGAYNKAYNLFFCITNVTGVNDQQYRASVSRCYNDRDAQFVKATKLIEYYGA